jgi:hypothetical protein
MHKVVGEEWFGGLGVVTEPMRASKCCFSHAVVNQRGWQDFGWNLVCSPDGVVHYPNFKTPWRFAQHEVLHEPPGSQSSLRNIWLFDTHDAMVPRSILQNSAPCWGRSGIVLDELLWTGASVIRNTHPRWFSVAIMQEPDVAHTVYS